MSTFTRTCGAALALLSLASFTSASPLYNHTAEPDLTELVTRAVPSNIPLKILCIGDSITAGLGSTTGNSYRLNLKFFLQAAGLSTDFVGREDFGSNNPDNQHEGYAAQTIYQIRDKLKNPNERKPSLPNPLSDQPNLVLIHAGTNDMFEQVAGQGAAGAPGRLMDLVNYVSCRVPNAVVLVAQIVKNRWQDNDALLERTRKFNEGVNVELYKKRINGERVWMVDQFVIPMGTENFMDQTHPNDNGYYKMAQIWYNGIQSIPNGEWRRSNPGDWVGRDTWCNNLGFR